MPQLSDAARAVIAGLTDDTGDFDKDRIYTPDSVWAEIHAAFPRHLYDAAVCQFPDGEIPAAYKVS